MVESLLSLSAKRVAVAMVDRQYENVDFRITDEVLSNSIFSSIREHATYGILPETLDEISEKLNVTRMKVDTQRDIANLSASQNLKELALGKEFLEGKDLNNILWKTLNLKNRKSLKKLSVEGVKLDETRKLADILPSVTCLSLHNCIFGYLENYNFFASFRKLKRLDLSDCMLSDLSGVSNMKNLEVLIVKDNRFESKECVTDVFKLRKLRVLDIGFSKHDAGLENNLKMFLECEKSLPELRFLECAKNLVTMDDLEKLVASHPKLEVVGLIGTTLERTPQLSIPNRNLKLLTVENFQNCLVSLNFYTQHSINSTECLDSIIWKTLVCSAPDSEISTLEDRRQCFVSMISILSRTTSVDFLTYACLSILEAVILKSDIIWTDQDCQLMVQTVIRVMDYFEFQPEDHRPICDVYNSCLFAWKILTSDLVGQFISGFTDKMCEEAAKVLHVMDRMRPPLLEVLLKFLESSLGKMNPTRRSALAQRYALFERLLNIQGSYDLSAQGENFVQCFMNVQYEFLRNADCLSLTHSSQSCQKRYIEQSIILIENFDEDYSAQNMILASLTKALEFFDSDLYGMFFDDWLREAILFLLITSSGTHGACVIFLFTLMQHQHGKFSNPALVLEQIFGNELVVGLSLDGVFIAETKSTSREAADFVTWMRRNFNKQRAEEEEGEEPASKVMRIG